MGQQNRIGQAVGHPIPPADAVGKGMNIAHIGPGKGHTGQEGSHQQLLPHFHIFGLFPHHRQRLVDHFGGHFGIAVGLRGGVGGNIGLQGVGQSIHCGVDGIPLRQADRQLRIEDGGKGHELGIEDLALAVGRGPTDDGGDGGLAAGAGRGGNRNERHRLLFHL